MNTSSGTTDLNALLQRRASWAELPRSHWWDNARTHLEATEPVLQAWIGLGEDGGAQHGGALDAVPFGVKDVIDVAGLPTGDGSRSRHDALPRRHHAAVVQKLVDRGARVFGKTATTEFAYLDAPATTNPFHSGHTPGGSSSGSAAAVGAGVVPLALGTQTAGSTCRPAAYCGAYAFKPTTGATPLAGVTPFAPSFDTVGLFAIDAGLLCQASSALLGLPASVADSTIPLRIGMLSDAYYADLAPDCRTALQRATDMLKAAGHTVDSFELGWDFETVRAEHRKIMWREAFDHHGHLLETRASLLGPHWRAALEGGALVGEAARVRALDLLRGLREEALRKMHGLDLMLLPPVRSSAPAGIGATGDAGLIVPWTIISSPLSVLPVGLSDKGLPLAVMLAGKPGRDAEALAITGRIAHLLAEAGMLIEGYPRPP